MLPWHSLHCLPGLAAMVPDWQELAGPQFPALKKLCLQPTNWTVPAFACPCQCGCRHYVIIRHDQSAAVAACRCEPPSCPDIELTMADITPLEVSKSALAAAIRSAFGLSHQHAELPLYQTFQVGAWSADNVPVILTIQFDTRTFRSVVAELVARLQKPFILLAPTAEHLDANCQELLARASAAFFALDTTTILTDDGRLLPAKPPGELFAQFTPPPTEPVPEDTARQLFALAKTLDAENASHKAPPSTVLRLYCVEAMEPNQIASTLGCARSLVYARLDLLRQKLGRHPSELRQYSSHFQNIEDSLCDPRAKRIYRQGAIDGEETPDETTDC